MATYTFVCDKDGPFIIKIPMESFTGTAECPKCHRQTSQRKYQKPLDIRIKIGRRKEGNAPPGKREYIQDRSD